MLDYWTNFALTGNPNGTGLTVWPTYNGLKDPYLDIKSPVASAEGLRTQKSDYWDRARGVSTTTRDHLALLGIKIEVPTIYQDGARIDLNLEEDLTFLIEVYNLLGQKISTVFQGELSAGRHELELKIPAAARGMLVLSTQTGGSRTGLKIWKE